MTHATTTSERDRLIRPTAPPFSNRPDLDHRAGELLAQMTLEEKVGQLVQFSSGGATGPDNVKVDERELAANGFIGSILNTTGAKHINPIQRRAVEDSRLGIPILFALDVIHGYRTIFPIPLGLASSWNLHLIERCARMSAVEATAEGIRWNFSPMIDVSRDARWGRIMESAGEDTLLNEVVAAAFVRGYQGSDLSDPAAMLACAKHFVGYGAAEGGRDYDATEIDQRTLRNTYLPPFKAALDAGCATVMSGFHTISGVPASANPFTLRTVLRDEWGFEGFVVSDWNSIGELIEHGVALDGRAAARKAFAAGVDMDMQANLYITELAGLVRTSEIPESMVDDAARRILRLKFALGLFENPYVDEAASAGSILTPEHRALARQAAEQSCVLLKNDPPSPGVPPLLPLDAAQHTVALIGPFASAQDGLLGGWIMRGKDADTAPIAPALREHFGDRLRIASGAPFKGETDPDEIAAAVEAATQADVAVLVLGETWDMSGEARSRTRLDLPDAQRELLHAVASTKTPIVLVLLTGRPLDLTREAAIAASLLVAWFPGTEAGPALANVLVGAAAPSGRLTASFPRHVGQMPLPYTLTNSGRPFNADTPENDMVVGYIDEARTPLFPFGFGLTYTSFAYSPPTVTPTHTSASAINAGETIKATATLTNTGARRGVETAQLYIGHRGGSIARPVRELVSFERVELDPGAAADVTFRLTSDDIARFNADGQRQVEAGELQIWIAPSASAGEPARVLLAE